MISPERVAEVKALLAAGISQRQVAAAVGISRNTVQAIDQGRRPDYKKTAAVRKAETHVSIWRKGQVVRCPECGGKVYWPCLLCRG